MYPHYSANLHFSLNICQIMNLAKTHQEIREYQHKRFIMKIFLFIRKSCIIMCRSFLFKLTFSRTSLDISLDIQIRNTNRRWIILDFHKTNEKTKPKSYSVPSYPSPHSPYHRGVFTPACVGPSARTLWCFNCEPRSVSPCQGVSPGH